MMQMWGFRDAVVDHLTSLAQVVPKWNHKLYKIQSEVSLTSGMSLAAAAVGTYIGGKLVGLPVAATGALMLWVGNATRTGNQTTVDVLMTKEGKEAAERFAKLTGTELSRNNERLSSDAEPWRPCVEGGEPTAVSGRKSSTVHGRQRSIPTFKIFWDVPRRSTLHSPNQ